MIAAVAADDLECFGVAAFCPAFYDADRLAPQARISAMVGMASRGRRRGFPGLDAVLGIAVMTGAVR
jgi:hypothetical protein